MDTLKIKAFLLTAKHKNFTKAANEISYTPSAFSHIADSLEEELGVKLFKRSRKGVEITEEGMKLYDKFVKITDAEQELLDAASFLASESEMCLKIGAYSSIALNLLPEILQSFKKANPNLKTTILVDDHMDNWIENGTADVIFIDHQIDCASWQPLMEDEFVAVVPESEFPDEREITLERLYDYPLIIHDEKLLVPYLDRSKFKETIAVKSIENNSALYMVRGNIGVAILPKINMTYAPSGIKVLKLLPKISRTIGIIYRDKNQSVIEKKFLQHTKRFCKT